MSIAHRVGKAGNDQQQSDQIQQANSGAQRLLAPAAAPTPKRAIPEPLGKIEHQQQASRDGDTQKEPGKNQAQGPPT